MQNTSIVKESEGNNRHPLTDNSSEEYADEVDDLRSHNSSVVDFALQNGVEALEFIVREMSLQNSMRDYADN